ncbi:MAG: HEAT repeat domain-containing protein, partial [Planctomycetales bacterium]|nr:HEAT repeat domain-containing protein [Planctomycetales bacterium]
KSAAEEEHEFFVPAALVLVGDETQPKRPRPVSDGSLTRLVSNATADGNHWFEENYAIDYPRWRFYYLYSLERYQSFRELAEKNDEPEPRWYNDGVEFLQSLQKDAGGFGNSSTASEAVDAAFATLFLMRSTKKSINKEVNYGDGLLAGGRGLPKNLADARVKRGKIVGEPLGGSADDVLSLLEDPNSPNFDKLVENPENVMVSPKLADDDRELDRLRRVIQGGNYAARKVAVRALATRRNLDNVPILIYALSDPDPEVAVEARDALRFISRRFRGFNMPENPTLEQRIEGINAWKKWYLSIRPDAEFLN